MDERAESAPTAAEHTADQETKDGGRAKRRSRRWFLSVSAGTGLAAGSVIASAAHAQTADGTGNHGDEHAAHVAQAQPQPTPAPQGQQSTPQASQIGTTQGFTYFTPFQ